MNLNINVCVLCVDVNTINVNWSNLPSATFQVSHFTQSSSAFPSNRSQIQRCDGLIDQWTFVPHYSRAIKQNAFPCVTTRCLHSIRSEVNEMDGKPSTSLSSPSPFAVHNQIQLEHHSDTSQTCRIRSLTSNRNHRRIEMRQQKQRKNRFAVWNDIKKLDWMEKA